MVSILELGEVRSELERRALGLPKPVDPGALALPSDRAHRVKSIIGRSGRGVLNREFQLDLHLISHDLLAAEHTGLSAPRSAEYTAGESRRQVADTDRFAGFVSKGRLVGHGHSPGFGGSASCQMPESPSPGRVTREGLMEGTHRLRLFTFWRTHDDDRARRRSAASVC